jgi:uncharacterized protein
MALAIQQLGPSHSETLQAFLAADPVANLFLLGVLDEFGIRGGPQIPPYAFYGRFSLTQRLGAVLFIGGQGGLWVPAGPPDDVVSLATGLPQTPPLHAAVGERLAVDGLVQRFVRGQPRIAREQKLMSVSADDLGPFTNPTLRPAREEESEALIPMAAAYVQETTGRDPLQEDPLGFPERVRRRIRARRTYVLEVNGRLVFKVDVGSRSEYGAELEGLYTLPDCRSQGHATLSLGQICRHLLSSIPRLTVRVDEESQMERIAQKVGFLGKHVSRFVIAR